jgi:hypothetical protein
MLVALAVLNSGTDFRELQLKNMLAIVVALAVLNNGTDCMEVQF